MNGEETNHRSEDDIDLGPCCACGQSRPDVRNIMMLNQMGPTPGKGWACFQCGLPPNGAIAVLCDSCLEKQADIRFVCLGYAAEAGRLPIEELEFEAFEHDMRFHPEVEGGQHANRT